MDVEKSRAVEVGFKNLVFRYLKYIKLKSPNFRFLKVRPLIV